MNRKDKAAEFLEEAYNISVTGRHVSVTQAMKDYAIEKVSKIEKFSDRIIDVTITMDLHKLEHRVDIVLKVDHTKIKSEATSNDMYASIDMAVRKIEAQLLRYKSKIRDHQAKRGAYVDMNVNVLRSAREDELLDVNSQIEEENRLRLLDKYHPHQIVKRDISHLKTLTDGEALMKMDLSGDQFLVYRGEDNLRIKIIYRRKDGDFGVIETQG